MAIIPQVTTPETPNREASVVTPERYEKGLLYADFLAQAPINRDKLEAAYKSSPLSAHDIAFFNAATALSNGPARMMGIAESWCPDVCRELPNAVRIAEETGMTLRIFLRDQNPDIMDEYVSNNGKSRAMPVIVFYTAEMRYITHFTERSKKANADLALSMDQARAELNLPPTANFGTLHGEERQAFIHALVRRVTPLAVEWQKASIQEIRQLLSTALNLPNPVSTEAAGGQQIPIVYTIRGCDSCMKLLRKLESDGLAYQERRVELSQAMLEEARKYGDMVPIVVWPDGKVEQGFEGAIGCFL
jgi:glutaredoxin